MPVLVEIVILDDFLVVTFVSFKFWLIVQTLIGVVIFRYFYMLQIVIVVTVMTVGDRSLVYIYLIV